MKILANRKEKTKKHQSLVLVKMSIVWLSFLLMQLVQCSPYFECAFDERLYHKIAVQNITYKTQVKTSESPVKRSPHISNTLFKPIRIFIYYSSEFNELPADINVQEFYRFVKTAVQIVSNFLAVIPIEGKLLLKRAQACYTYWNTGINKNRCSRLRSGYKGEYCMNQLPIFRIPDEHLEGISLFNYSDVTPTNNSIPSGNGVDADYILYLQTVHTERCDEDNKVIAYAYYCQQDQNGRPIAGYINFCPNGLQNSVITNEKAIPIVIHELFHALGYSVKLFDKYRVCLADDTEEQCSFRKRVITQDHNGIFRLLLPSVIREMKQHFKCNLEDFGGPLEPRKEDPQSASSHWDPRIMYGSIMASQLRKSEFIFIDPITLAVFEDSGWYQVNYSLADYYPWGKDQGCEFGLPSTCENVFATPQFFCSPLSQSKVCDYGHYGKSNCSEEISVAPCNINKPYPTEFCQSSFVNKDNISIPSGFHGSRCFLVQEQNESFPICLNHRCSNDSSLEVLWNNTWLPCPYNTLISLTMDNSTLIECPLEGILCKRGKWRYLATKDKHEISGCRSSFCFMYITLHLSLAQIVVFCIHRIF